MWFAPRFQTGTKIYKKVFGIFKKKMFFHNILKLKKYIFYINKLIYSKTF
jgi:hypothetical protein